MRLLFRLFLLTLLLAVAGCAYAYYLLIQPYQGFSQDKFLEFPKGTSTSQMAQLLKDAGVIRHEKLFLLARLLSPRATLQAGEYRFARPASTLTIYRRIAQGDIFYYELLAPEGWNMFDIAAAAAKLGVFSAGDFLKAARNPQLIRDLDPRARTLEGYLFPNTYRLTRHTGPRELCLTMTRKFREVWQTLGAPAEPHDVVTLASLIEREARLPSERPLVASVFSNRLHLGMKLDCDPTTVYAALLESRYRGTIYRSDLASPNAYNTYQHAGLPPGPIANPSLSSIQAALHPKQTNYLYFVAKADGSGSHTFSEDLRAHEAAIAQYRRATKTSR